MLIYTEVSLAKINRGDHVAVEVGDVHIAAAVVGTDLDQGALGIVPLGYAEPSENGTGFAIRFCRPPVAPSEVLTVVPGEGGVKVFKAIDSDAAVTEPLTWERIAELEPKVLELLDEIKAECPREGNYQWILRRYKDRLSEFVGWGREAPTHPELRSSAAYDVVYDMLLNNLRDPE